MLCFMYLPHNTRVMSYIHTAFLYVNVRSIKAYYTVQTIINLYKHTVLYFIKSCIKPQDIG